MRKGALNRVKKYKSKIDGIIADLEVLIEEEQGYFDERSDEWQESDKGEEFSDRIYAIEEFKDALENAIYDVDDVLE